MITQICAWLTRRSGRRTAGDVELAAFADRIEAGDLTPRERAEVAELVVVAATAAAAAQECPVGVNAAIWAAGAWEPVGVQVTHLLTVIRS